MENYVCIFALLLVICACCFVFTNASLSSEEVRTLDRKVEFMNGELQNKLSVVLFEIQELKNKPMKCECKQHSSIGKIFIKNTFNRKCMLI